jgi:hypothetical protein
MEYGNGQRVRYAKRVGEEKHYDLDAPDRLGEVGEVVDEINPGVYAVRFDDGLELHLLVEELELVEG